MTDKYTLEDLFTHLSTCPPSGDHAGSWSVRSKASSFKLVESLEGLQQELNSISILVPSSRAAAAPVDADGVVSAKCGGV